MNYEQSLIRCIQMVNPCLKVEISIDLKDQGIDSLSLLALHRHITNHLCPSLSLETLAKCRTPNDIIQAVKLTYNQLADDNIILLKLGSFANPLVLIHPAGGSVFCYTYFSKAAKTSRAIFAIQDTFINNNFQLYNSMDDIVNLYLDKINKLCNKFSIAGYSLGGSIAYAICERLDHDQRIDECIIIDSWAEPPYKMEMKQALENILLRQIDSLGLKYIPSFSSRRDDWLKTIWNRLDIQLKYKPNSINNTSLVLFKPKTILQEYSNNTCSKNGWGNLCRHLKTFTIDGNHETILNERSSQKILDLLEI